MAAPILGGIYATLARLGYRYIATPLKPRNLGKVIEKITPKTVKEAEFSPEMTRFLEGSKKKISSGYRSLYGNTLGKQKGRQVAGGALGTYATMSFLNGDDDNMEE